MAEEKHFINSEHVIPALRNKTAFLEWLKIKRGTAAMYEREVRWGWKGDRTFYEEYEGKEIGEKIIKYLLERLKNNKGKLKITSFGGGKLQGVLDLREMLIALAAEDKLPVPDIHIIDYSLTQRPGRRGIEKRQSEQLLEQGVITLVGMPLEVVNLEKAKDSDVMISMMGPFMHAEDKQHELEMLQKVLPYLASKSKAFLQLAFDHPPTIQANDGKNYQLKELDREAGIIEVSEAN